MNRGRRKREGGGGKHGKEVEVRDRDRRQGGRRYGGHDLFTEDTGRANTHLHTHLGAKGTHAPPHDQ